MHASIYLSAFLAFNTSTVLGRPAPTKESSSRISRLIEAGVDKYLNITHDQQKQQQCMSREEALNVAGTFQSLIRGYTKEQALAALTPDFVDHTSAVSIIINRGGSEPENLTEPVFTSRDEFMQGHGTQEPIP
jgi:hypothetical protein